MRARILIAVACGAAVLLAGCKNGEDAAAPAPSAAAGASPSSAPADCPTGSPPAGKPGSRDPFSALGARQEPGPQMTPVPIPASPVTRTMNRPPSPDEGAAALQPDGRQSGPPPVRGPAGLSVDPACFPEPTDEAP